MDEKTVCILLVEDDDIDAEGIKRAFKRQKIANPIVRAKDGMEALSILRAEEGAKTLDSQSVIILLDINMPRMNGHEFLTEVRKDEKLKSSLIFVLTTSEAENDIYKAYEKNVAGYILKSRAGSDFANLICLLDNYWRFVEIPSN